MTSGNGLWRSLVSALDWGSRGRRFKSSQPDHEVPGQRPWCQPGPRPEGPSVHEVSTDSWTQGGTVRPMRGAVRKPRTRGTWSYRIELGHRRGRAAPPEAGRRLPDQARCPGRSQCGPRCAWPRHLRLALQGHPRSVHRGVAGRGKPELGLSAWDNYRMVLTRNVAPRLGHLRLTDVTALRLQRLYTDLLASGRADGGPLSPRSVQLTHRILHRALADAVRWRLLALNPADQVRGPKVERKEQRGLDRRGGRPVPRRHRLRPTGGALDGGPPHRAPAG